MKNKGVEDTLNAKGLTSKGTLEECWSKGYDKGYSEGLAFQQGFGKGFEKGNGYREFHEGFDEGFGKGLLQGKSGGGDGKGPGHTVLASPPVLVSIPVTPSDARVPTTPLEPEPDSETTGPEHATYAARAGRPSPY